MGARPLHQATLPSLATAHVRGSSCDVCRQMMRHRQLLSWEPLELGEILPSPRTGMSDGRNWLDGRPCSAPAYCAVPLTEAERFTFLFDDDGRFITDSVQQSPLSDPWI